jgi:L-ascorbate metabolism protein UlaG (beta-lactamase superfamily)
MVIPAYKLKQRASRLSSILSCGNPSAVSAPDDIKTDAVLLTHAHIDHILDAEPIALGNDVSVVAIGELATYMTGRESRRFQ